MEIRNFITFNAVVESEGFTAAGKILNYSQSTVSLQIKDLEAYYNTPLFDRIGKKVFLTSFGQNLYSYSKDLAAHHDKILNLNSSQKKKAVLRIGIFDSLLKYRLSHILHLYQKEFPLVKLIIDIDIPIHLRDKLRKGELDIIFQVEPSSDFTDLKSSILTNEDFKLIFPKGKTLEYMHLQDQSVFLTEKNCSYRGFFEKFLDKKGISGRNVIETGSVDLIKQFVELDMGFAMVPAFTVEFEANNSVLSTFEIDIPQFFTQIAYHKNKYLFPQMKEFISMVEKNAKHW
jgi:DNA-binding transcriptional LysR family regulator